MCLLTFGENEQKDGVAIANNHADKFYLTAGLYACTAIKKPMSHDVSKLQVVLAYFIFT